MTKTCNMLEVPDPESTRDVECGKPAKWQYKTGKDHVICQSCYDAMFDDQEIQGYYEPIEEEECPTPADDSPPKN
jgi:hypothetical protein